MVAFAFYPYEDEDLYSWVIRYHFYSMNDLESQTKKDLFENGYFDFKLHYPSRINTLSSKLQMLEGFSVKEILMKHTYINIIKPFFTNVRYEDAKYGLLESDKGVLRNHGFHINNLFLNDKNTIKICPICYEEDIKAVGEPYLHRPHNVIGVRTCYKHGCYLDSVKNVFTGKNSFYDVNKGYSPGEILYPIEHERKIHQKINNDIVFVLNGGLNSITPEIIRERLEEKFKLLGIFTVPNSDRHPILKGILSEYGHNLLKEYESDFELIDKKIWLRAFLHRSYGDVNPIRQIIALGYIFGNLQNFLEFDEVFEPFGKAPFPCLNHICDNYHEDVIDNYSESLSDDRKGVISTFKCSTCGFTYSRRSELLYSVVARYHSCMPDNALKDTIDDVFGTRSISVSPEFPNHLQELATRLDSPEVSKEDLLYKNTLFPLYEPFLFLNEIEDLKSKMYGSGGGAIKGQIGFLSGSILKKERLYYCPKCVEEDTKRYGESYFRSTHQMQGNLVCSEHNVMLEKYPISQSDVGRVTYIRLDFDLASYTATKNLNINLYYISQIYEDIYNGKLNGFNASRLKEVYLRMLKEMDLLSYGAGEVRYPELIQKFYEFYGEYTLKLLESEIDPEFEFNWLRKLLRTKKIKVHPLRHVLFIKLIFSSIDELIEFSKEPVKKEMYPCLNKICESYLEDIVSDVVITPDYKTRVAVGTFKCTECGYTYSRKMNADRNKVGRVKEFGAMWLKS